MSVEVIVVAGAVISTVARLPVIVSSGSPPKIVLNSLRNIDKTGAGIFNVGEKTIPTIPESALAFFLRDTKQNILPFRTVILFRSELSTIVMRKAESARSSE